MRCALDTNVLAYAEGVIRGEADRWKRDHAQRLVERLGPAKLVLPVQALAELFFVLHRKAGLSPGEAAGRIGRWMAVELAPTTAEVVRGALALAGAHQVQIFDAIIIRAGLAAGCDLLLTEDLPSGRTVEGLRIVNPFEQPLPEPLRLALDGAPG